MYVLKHPTPPETRTRCVYSQDGVTRAAAMKRGLKNYIHSLGGEITDTLRGRERDGGWDRAVKKQWIVRVTKGFTGLCVSSMSIGAMYLL